jgi:uncharacterized protein (DUF2141 family)
VALFVIALLPGAAPTTDLTVDLDGVRSDKGVLRLCLTGDPDAFPGCVDGARGQTRTVPADVRQVTFTGLAPGSYAVAVIHDENDNARLDRFAGIPREGFGFSRNPPLGFGPPSFAAARFAVGSDAVAQQVRLRYIL